MTTPSTAIKRYGTEEPIPTSHTLSAGLLSALLDNGNLRYIKVQGREALRAISFIVRDSHWGTYNPEIHDLHIDSDENGFSVSYRAICKDAEQELGYQVRIEGAAAGKLRFSAELEPVTDWVTMRTGFVVLHGVQGIAGEPVTIVHTDGTREQSHFPELIKPDQPFFDIQAMIHQVAPGLSVECVMQGDAFETEDQRNWSDASFKTYIRPLAKRPAPYTLTAGERSSQSVELSVHGAGDKSATVSQTASTVHKLKLGTEAAGPLPALGLAMTAQWVQATLERSDLLGQVRPLFLVCRYDPNAGHDAATMASFKSLADKLGVELWLEAVLPCRNAQGEFSSDRAVLDSDLDALLKAAAEVDFAAIIACPEAYLKSYQPDGVWPEVPALEAIYTALRARFPHARIGGGMHSYFTELNRKRPPASLIDFITHSTCPIVHAADDISVMESLESLPSVMRSALNLGAGKPYCIGPSAIGMRMNPYGVNPADNPNNARVPMARVDPRQRGLFNAAWTLGYIAHATGQGVTALTLSAPVGEHGIIYTKTDWSQPWFDEAASASLVYPVYHVLRGLGQVASKPARQLESSAPNIIQGLAVDTDQGKHIWLANLSAETCELTLDGIAAGARVQYLDDTTFEHCCMNPDSFNNDGAIQSLERLTLQPYAVARLVTDA